MNRYRFIAVLSIVLAFLWAACNDDNGMGEIEDPDTPGREQASLRLLNNRAIGRLGGAYYWAVKANEDWQVDDMELPEWLSFDPISGEAGITSVTLTADTLFTDEAREAVLTFLMATDTVDITVQQLAEGEIPMDETLCRFADTRVFGVETYAASRGYVEFGCCRGSRMVASVPAARRSRRNGADIHGYRLGRDYPGGGVAGECGGHGN